MGSIEKFEDILVWQKGRELARRIYRCSGNGAFGTDFALRDQIRRAVVSITSNIAEGFERAGNKEFIQFLSNPKGSCGEVRSQLYIALDQGYITNEQFHDFYQLGLEIRRLIDGFISYLRTAEIKERKFDTSKRTPS